MELSARSPKIIAVEIRVVVSGRCIPAGRDEFAAW